ncbi:HNH endonuclease family protein [Tomitella biformata]|uniref:HNH endonuclease family protein n=1 Tax=Tomitella biformata TaxID=630403 RepID=UPI001F3EC32A|nr:HNH endonuclease family protein [Tomitella biformata]
MAVGYVVVEDWLADDVAGPPATLDTSEFPALLAQLRVGPESPMAGYSRDEFPHWDRNKPEHGFGPEFDQYSRCTTRDVMLLRDAVGSVQLDPSTCKLTIGADGGWQDQYGFIDRKTGQMKPYKWMADSTGVDAEHIVPLAEAWRSGAADLDVDARRGIANDAINLEASDPSANRSKGDQDASTYLPPGNFRCEYTGRYMQIKVKYGLAVNPEELAKLRVAVDDCAG